MVANSSLLPPVQDIPADRPKIRLILSDYDGTFTNHTTNEVVAENIEGFKLAQKLGIFVGIASGRGRMSVVDGIQQAKNHDLKYEGHPGVFCNGAIVFAPEGEKLVDCVVPKDVQTRLLDFLKKEGLVDSVTGLTEGDTFCQDYNKDTLVCFNEYNEERPLLIPRENGGLYSRAFNKLMLWNPHERLLEIRKKIETEFKGAIVCTMPYPTLLEFVYSAQSKGNGLKALCKHLGISTDEVLVLGDSENDVSMFKVAGIAVVVADGAAPAKQAAHYQSVPSGSGPLLDVVRTLQSKGLVPNL